MSIEFCQKISLALNALCRKRGDQSVCNFYDKKNADDKIEAALLI